MWRDVISLQLDIGCWLIELFDQWVLMVVCIEVTQTRSKPLCCLNKGPTFIWPRLVCVGKISCGGHTKGGQKLGCGWVITSPRNIWGLIVDQTQDIFCHCPETSYKSKVLHTSTRNGGIFDIRRHRNIGDLCENRYDSPVKIPGNSRSQIRLNLFVVVPNKSVW